MASTNPAPSSPVWPARVVIRDVALRDGLQILPRTVPTATKLEWLRAAHAAGLREMEVGSFVPAHRLPQLADTAEVLALAKTLPGLKATVLVPNFKGAERAIAEEAHAMLVPISASHAHSLANLRKTPDDVVAAIMACLKTTGREDHLLDVGTGVETTILEAARTIALINGASLTNAAGGRIDAIFSDRLAIKEPSQCVLLEHSHQKARLDLEPNVFLVPSP